MLVDDSISSGTSFFKAAQILERNGYEVEGTVCLVDFSYRGGRERAQARGYKGQVPLRCGRTLKIRVASVRRPTSLVPRVWSPMSAPEGCHPAVVARRVAEHFIQTAEVLRPPDRFDREEDGRGGVWVSFRRRADDTRLARDGFWHFGPVDADPARDLVLATVATLQRFKPQLTVDQLSQLKIAVSFFTQLEEHLRQASTSASSASSSGAKRSRTNWAVPSRTRSCTRAPANSTATPVKSTPGLALWSLMLSFATLSRSASSREKAGLLMVKGKRSPRVGPKAPVSVSGWQPEQPRSSTPWSGANLWAKRRGRVRCSPTERSGLRRLVRPRSGRTLRRQRQLAGRCDRKSIPRSSRGPAVHPASRSAFEASCCFGFPPL